MNLAYKFPILFWNTANLIVDSGAMDIEKKLKIDEESEEDETVKNSAGDYGKIATAIGKIQETGVSFSLPDINTSKLTFTPDLANNTILYGLRGITRIGNQLIKDIIENRPYKDMSDFLKKVKVNKVQMINLIKSGVFDSLYSDLSRKEIMDSYIDSICEKKNKLTLQNMAMLISFNLIPEELNFSVRVYNYNKYVKTLKDENYYKLDCPALKFYLEFFDETLLKDLYIDGENDSAKIEMKIWDKIYKKEMEPVKDWLKENQEKVLKELNNKLYEQTAEKYTEGNISKWEMDSLNFYYHEHELSVLDNYTYSLSDFKDLPEEPEVERTFTTKDGTEISIYKVYRIAGTVIDKNKDKGNVTLLTPSGVVNVKVWKNQFGVWDKQISGIDEATGKKHVLEKSWFTRGTKLIITGIKRDGNFVPKKYKNTEFPLFERIDEISEKGIITKSATERIEE